MAGLQLDYFITSPKPEDIKIMTPSGRIRSPDDRLDKRLCLPEDRLEDGEWPTGSIVTCRTAMSVVGSFQIVPS